MLRFHVYYKKLNIYYVSFLLGLSISYQGADADSVKYSRFCLMFLYSIKVSVFWWQGLKILKTWSRCNWICFRRLWIGRSWSNIWRSQIWVWEHRATTHQDKLCTETRWCDELFASIVSIIAIYVYIYGTHFNILITTYPVRWTSILFEKFSRIHLKLSRIQLDISSILSYYLYLKTYRL